MAFDMLYCVAFEMMDAHWLAMRASYMEFNVTISPLLNIYIVVCKEQRISPIYLKFVKPFWISQLQISFVHGGCTWNWNIKFEVSIPWWSGHVEELT